MGMEHRFRQRIWFKSFIEFLGSFVLGLGFYFTYGFGAPGLFITALVYLLLTYVIGPFTGAFLNPNLIIAALVSTEWDSFGKSKSGHFRWRGYRFVTALVEFIVIYIGIFLGALLALFLSGTANSVVIASSVGIGIGTEFTIVTILSVVYLITFDTDVTYTLTVVQANKAGKFRNHKNPNQWSGLTMWATYFSFGLATAAIAGGTLNAAIALNANLVFWIAGGGTGPLASSGWLTLGGFGGAILGGLLYLLIKYWFMSDYRRGHFRGRHLGDVEHRRIHH